MKEFNNKKSILERGGLMIEALAMLGLIAVVTPTMYKKSAERTMEVEDINTATSMRTIMGAAEAYMSSNYADIMKVMEEDTNHQHDVGDQTIGVMDIPVADLAPYLPYKFNETAALYNYNSPKIRIVRAGDNLTAFALFPAKVGAADGIGQERTVRIASLIGANGGYVSSADGAADKKARGVGGVWNLEGDYYDAVFDQDDQSHQYSLVTSSSNVVNGSNAMAEADPTQFLQRTKQEGASWRNAMRTDLYMGNDANAELDPDDREHTNDLFSIRNINQLIVGTETEAEQQIKKGVRDELLDNFKVEGEYGLYVDGSGSDGSNAGNAYIKDTLIAAGNRFWASSGTLKYTGTNLEFDGTNFYIGKNQPLESDDADNYVVAGHAEKDKSTLDVMGDKINVAEAGDIGHYKPTSGGGEQNKSNIVIHTTNINTNTDSAVKAPEYSDDSKAPEFGVDIDGNMVVEGVLAAGQLDVNQVRTSSLSVGSEHIDDAYKWMDVDKTGVHIHEPNSSYGAAKPGTQVEVKSKLIALRAGDAANVDDGSVSEHPAQIILTDTGIVQKVDADKTLSVATDKIGINIKNKEMQIGNVDEDTLIDNNVTDIDYLVNYKKGGDVNIEQGNLKVSDGSQAVFTVRGKDNISGIVDNVTGNGGNDYHIAGHGNVVFTDALNSNGYPDVKYLAMQNTLSSDVDDHAAVNVIRGVQDSTTMNARGLVYVDMDERSTEAYSLEPGQNATDVQVNDMGTDRTLQAGGIYIRRGLIDIVPDKSYSENPGDAGTGSAADRTADEGRGVIRASRFVANNVVKDGSRVVVPQFFAQGKYEEYNNTSYSPHATYNDTNKTVNRYDTYMVNPAYTSVMNDIKLASRGGARLSDILPVFITKGIYTAVNNKSETTYNVATNLDSAYLSLVANGGSYILNIDRQNNTWDPNEPASPIIGVVPTPQCPPGYARMITVTPASIRMAEAGRFKRPYEGNFNGFKIDVDDFTNPTNNDYWIDSNNQVHTISDLSNLDNIPAAEVDKLGQALQLYRAYKETFDSNNRPNVARLNPAYQEGVHLVGGDECWRNANGECVADDGFDGKMELDVSPAPGDTGAGATQNGDPASNNTIRVTKGRRDAVSTQSNRNHSTVPGTDYTHEIQQGTTNVAKAYYTKPGKINPGEVVEEKYHNVANVISGDGLNKQIITMHDVDDDGNMQHYHYNIKSDIDVSGTRLLVDRMRNVKTKSRSGEDVYMLTSSTKNAFEPITFQKSTWLKSSAVPLKIDGSSEDYASGWAILMGFIYPRAAYENVLSTLGVNNNYQKVYSYYKADSRNVSGFDNQRKKNRWIGVDNTGNNVYDSNVDEYFFWNVFPVEQESLEAFVTTYCYFDQDGRAFNQFRTNNGNIAADVADHLPMIDYITTFPQSYRPEGSNLNYRKKLNDPSMEYNELW